jgi:hypothetical protein
MRQRKFSANFVAMHDEKGLQILGFGRIVNSSELNTRIFGLCADRPDGRLFSTPRATGDHL